MLCMDCFGYVRLGQVISDEKSLIQVRSCYVVLSHVMRGYVRLGQVNKCCVTLRHVSSG